MQFGIYFYPWYNKTRWAEAPRLCAPRIGEYDSTDPVVVEGQMSMLLECGFDYVIFELVPKSDWCFPTVERAIETALNLLRKKGARWSFLLDAYVVPDQSRAAEEMDILVQTIRQRGWTDGLVRGPGGKPLLFVFFPRPADADHLREVHTNYELRFPAYMPHWGELGGNFDVYDNTPWRECLERVREKGGTVFDALVPEGYISFFETTVVRSNFDGFASVIPSFNDRLLQRTTIPLMPIVDAADGATLQSNLERAVATEPDHVLVYGWNEYFEGSTIEPTLEYGMRHVEICKEFILPVKASRRGP